MRGAINKYKQARKVNRQSKVCHASFMVAAREKRAFAWSVSVSLFSITGATGAAQKLLFASYLVKNPASTGKAQPVIWRASSDASHSTTELMSSGFKRLLSCKRFISFMRAITYSCVAC